MKFFFERVFIETSVDTDGDGKLDLIAAYIRRPDFTVCDKQNKVPAVVVANPYLMTCNEDWYKLYDVNKELTVYPDRAIKEEDIRYDVSNFKEYVPTTVRKTKGFAETAVIDENVEFEAISDLYSYLNEKGYATVFCGGLGTLGSEGFTLSGSHEEILAFKSVIDWLNGRCRAFTNKTDNIEIKATWCTGNVAMSAKSYLGTMCIGVAATGVEGLKTIIPEAGISNWYNYYRTGGLAVSPLEWQGDDIDLLALYCFSRAKDEKDYASCKDDYKKALDTMIEKKDRESGDYNLFWDERNYLNSVDKFKASVFIIHGINDWNVKTNQSIPLFKELEKHGVERKMLLHQGDHAYVYDLEGGGVLNMIERWLDHYLRGTDNGIEKEPKVLVESNQEQTKWMTSDTWPPADWKYVSLTAKTAETKAEAKPVITDDLSKTVYNRASDNQREWRDELVLSTNQEYKNRIKFVWKPEDLHLAAGTRIAGKITVSFEASIDRRSAILSVMLVELGVAKRITCEQVAIEDEHPALKKTFKFGFEEEPSEFKVISRGHLNAQNRTCLWNKENIEPGKFLHYEIEMVPTDHTLTKGSKIGLIIYGIDAEQTIRPETVTNITIDTESIKMELPVV